jgi:1,5-anhydro-D-fructose reductase (1,5-anhydro-D-mannitol-forming)
MSSKQVRYGIIGFGNFAEQTILPAILSSPNSRVVALQKRSMETAKEKAKQYHIPHAFDSVEALAQCPDVDAVYVASAVCRHAADVIAAAKAGKHVLVEKPMAMNAAEAEAMIAACKKYHVKLMVAQMLRFSPVLQDIKEVMKSGMIGNVTLIRAEYFYDVRQSKRWWSRNKMIAGGGPVFDIGVHCIDAIRYLLEDEVLSVQSVLQPPPTDEATERTALLMLKFSQGTIGSIFCSFDVPYRRMLLELIGEEGSITANDFGANDADVSVGIALGKNGKRGTLQKHDVSVPNLYENEITFFSRSIRNNTEPPIPGEEGLKNQRILDAAVSRYA